MSEKRFTPTELARLLGVTRRRITQLGIARLEGTGRWVRYSAEAIEAAARSGKSPALTAGWLRRGKASPGPQSRSAHSEAIREQSNSHRSPDDSDSEPEVELLKPLFLGPRRNPLPRK